MACAVVAPAPEPGGDFPAWLEAQGVNEEVARAMDSELGIRDYGVLRACVGDGLVRAELLAAARDRLPFGFYAVLRQVVKALRGAERQDGTGTPLLDDEDATASFYGDVTLGGLVDVLLELFNGLSRELLLCVQRLNEWDGVQPPAASSATDVGSLEDATTAEMDYDELEEVSAPVAGDFACSLTVNRVKMEPFEDAGKDFANPVPIPRPSEIGSVAHTTNEPLGKRPLAGYANLIAQNMASQPASRTTAALAAGIRPHPWPWQRQQQEAAAEMHGEETVAVARCNPPTRRRPFASSDATAGETIPLKRGQTLPADGGDDASYAFYSGKPLGPPEGAGERPSWREPCGPRRRRRAGERPCRCEARGRTFSQGCHAKPRVRAHAGERSYRCDVCGKVFTRATVLRFHQRLHADDSP